MNWLHLSEKEIPVSGGTNGNKKAREKDTIASVASQKNLMSMNSDESSHLCYPDLFPFLHFHLSKSEAAFFVSNRTVASDWLQQCQDSALDEA